MIASLANVKQSVLRQACHPPPAIATNLPGSRILPWRKNGRTYANATERSKPSAARRQVTVISDDGRVRWADLSRREKAARTTQQSLNFITVLVGLVMTGGVMTFLYLEVFSTESKTSQFNRAVDRVRQDSRCTALLGPGRNVKAYGEPTWNKWARARPIASTSFTDRSGVEHLQMHFNVEGPLNKGVVRLHMVKTPSETEFKYRLLALDVPGQSRIYLENVENTPGHRKSKAKSIFGVRWS